MKGSGSRTSLDSKSLPPSSRAYSHGWLIRHFLSTIGHSWVTLKRDNINSSMWWLHGLYWLDMRIVIYISSSPCHITVFFLQPLGVPTSNISLTSRPIVVMTRSWLITTMFPLEPLHGLLVGLGLTGSCNDCGTSLSHDSPILGLPLLAFSIPLQVSSINAM